MEDVQNNLANIKFQFETYQTDSTNSYSVLKTLYDDAKQETSVFMHRIEKCTKEHEVGQRTRFLQRCSQSRCSA